MVREHFLTFDDVLLTPKFSRISTRADCSTITKLGKISLDLPVISANMDTITGVKMANAMAEVGGIGALHRFSSIDENVSMFNSTSNCFVSVGIGEKELDRAKALYNEGARAFIIDVAHAASESVVNFYNNFREFIGSYAHVMVGNFSTADSITAFINRTKVAPDSFKVGIGGGSMCTTRVVTGVGVPTLGSVLDCRRTGRDIIADGGIRNSGDIAKCLAAGAKAVMIGSMLAGTDETPGDIEMFNDVPYKVYRGSASKESYEVQGKVANHRAPEGESTYVPLKGSTKNILQNIKAGIQSSMSYLNAKNLQEFRENATFIEITNNGMIESRAHGKK
jgi:IMP dehydrogenase